MDATRQIIRRMLHEAVAFVRYLPTGIIMPDGSFSQGDHHEIAQEYFSQRRGEPETPEDVEQALELYDQAMAEYDAGEIDDDELYDATWDAMNPMVGYLLQAGAIRVRTDENIMEFSTLDERTKRRAAAFLKEWDIHPDTTITVESRKPLFSGKVSASAMMDQGITPDMLVRQGQKL